jgi:hypothetical protein
LPSHFLFFFFFFFFCLTSLNYYYPKALTKAYMHDKYPMPSSTAAWFGSGKRMKQEIQQKKVESHNIYTFYLKNEQERGAKRSKNYLIIQNFQYDEWCLSKASKWTTGGDLPSSTYTLTQHHEQFYHGAWLQSLCISE